MGFTQRVVLIIFKGRKIVKKRIFIFHLCIINVIFLFFITLEAMAGTYVYYNEKGEKVSYINKNENQNSNKTNTESVQTIHNNKNMSQYNNDQIYSNQIGKNQQDNKKR